MGQSLHNSADCLLLQVQKQTNLISVYPPSPYRLQSKCQWQNADVLVLFFQAVSYKLIPLSLTDN